ncbi:MAG: hypothetical protein QME54_02690 [Actinomycetota bacterium]|nr:hypothetical protein [Actinomycetota bacterium]
MSEVVEEEIPFCEYSNVWENFLLNVAVAGALLMYEARRQDEP